MKKTIVVMGLVLLLPLSSWGLESDQGAIGILKQAFTQCWNAKLKDDITYPAVFLDSVSKQLKSNKSEAFNKTIIDSMARVFVTGTLPSPKIAPQNQNFGGVRNQSYGVNSPARKMLAESIRKVVDIGSAVYFESRMHEYAKNGGELAQRAIRGVKLYTRNTQPWTSMPKKDSDIYNNLIDRSPEHLWSKHVEDTYAPGTVRIRFKNVEGGEGLRYSALGDGDCGLISMNVRRDKAYQLLTANQQWLAQQNPALGKCVEDELWKFHGKGALNKESISVTTLKVIGCLSGFNVIVWTSPQPEFFQQEVESNKSMMQLFTRRIKVLKQSIEKNENLDQFTQRNNIFSQESEDQQGVPYEIIDIAQYQKEHNNVGVSEWRQIALKEAEKALKNCQQNTEYLKTKEGKITLDPAGDDILFRINDAPTINLLWSGNQLDARGHYDVLMPINASKPEKLYGLWKEQQFVKSNSMGIHYASVSQFIPEDAFPTPFQIAREKIERRVKDTMPLKRTQSNLERQQQQINETESKIKKAELSNDQRVLDVVDDMINKHGSAYQALEYLAEKYPETGQGNNVWKLPGGKRPSGISNEYRELHQTDGRKVLNWLLIKAIEESKTIQPKNQINSNNSIKTTEEPIDQELMSYINLFVRNNGGTPGAALKALQNSSHDMVGKLTELYDISRNQAKAIIQWLRTH